jgi:YidC/Oxa1 family membrane protein insertase
MTWLGIVKPPERQPQTTEPAPTQAEPITEQRQVEQSPTTQTTQPPPATPPDTGRTETAFEEVRQSIPEDSIFIETDVWSIILTNHGGGPISFKLKNYFDQQGQPIQMLPDCDEATPEFTYQAGALQGNQFVYESSLATGRHKVDNQPLELTYSYRQDNGGSINKRYRFYPDRYYYDLVIEISQRDALGVEREYFIEWNNPLEPTELNISDDYNSFWAMARFGTENKKYDDYDEGRFSESQDGVTHWIATRSKFFTAILVPRSEPGTGAKASGLKTKVTTDNGTADKRELAIGLKMEIPYEPALTDSFAVFVGPLDYEILNDFNGDVSDIVDIGTTPFVGWIIKIFAIPIMWLLPRMYSVIPNYGLVIILFAFLVKAITWPLSKKTVRSMMAMRDLQPQLEELKKKHKKNPQALNREMMKLYKEKGINPLSGCLPYLPQLPLFFALFSVFRSTILLRQAPFILWWDDLSRGALSVTDPYIILVILMAGLMFLQQKMTMTDPKNKMLIYLMPLMMGFFFYRAAAGLVLYWTCFSLFSWLEQLVFKRPQPQPAEAEVKPAKK